MRRNGIIFLIYIVFEMLLFTISLADDYERYKVNTISFEGNSEFTDKRLKRLMLSSKSGLFASPRFYGDVFNDDLNNLKTFYHQNGYLEMDIVETIIVPDTVKSSVAITIKLNEGELTRVEGIGIFGNNVFDDSLLLSKIKLSQGEPFRRNRVQEGMVNIITMYADKGYLDASIKPEIKINHESKLAVIDLNITENEQSHINNINITELNKTRSHVVMRELNFKRGEVVNYSRLMESQRRLYLTGLFESVFIRPVPTSKEMAGYKDILIELKERLSSEFNVALGYGSVDQARARLELLTSNLQGKARQAGVSFRGSFIRRSVETSFTEPWTFGVHLRTDINGMYEYLEEPAYHLNRFNARFTLGYSLSASRTVTLSYRFEEANIDHVEVGATPEEFDSRIRSLMLTFVNDTRDNIFDTHDGKYLEWSNELAGSFLKGSDSFVRSIIRIKRFYSPNINTTFGSAIEIGWMDRIGKSTQIPLQERFYAGGPNSIRSFGYQLAGPLQDKDTPIGGKFKIVWNIIEVRRSVYKMIGVAGFVDIGNVWLDIEEFNLDDMKIAIGPGLRVGTPLGTIRLDYGFNPSPDEYESKGELFFNIGQTF